MILCILVQCSDHFDNWIVVEMFGSKSVIQVMMKFD